MSQIFVTDIELNRRSLPHSTNFDYLPFPSVEEPVKYDIPYNAICGLIPCVRYRTETRRDVRRIVNWEEKVVPSCCPGYFENFLHNCIPVCLDNCRNGKCIKPNVCKCDPEPTDSSPGFVGATCNRFTCLDDNKWGTKCDKDCNCPMNAYCHATTGKCLCRSNWRGPDCTQVCNSTTECDEVNLPPVIEPDLNSIPTDDIGRADRLVLSRDAGIEDDDPLSSFASYAFTQTSINLLLMFVTSLLIFTVFRYRRRLNELRNDIYPPSGSGSGSTYGSDPSYYSTISNAILRRPRMPTPDEASQMSKNISFDNATRSILKGTAAPIIQGQSTRLILNPKVESHLIASQMESEENIYSEIQPSSVDATYSVIDISPSENITNLDSDLSTSLTVNPNTDYSPYQVPKSPSIAVPKTSDSSVE